MKIIAGMFAAGDALFNKMAGISVPSFLRANVDCDLVFFSDSLSQHTNLARFRKLTLKSYTDYYNQFPDEVADFDKKIEHPRCDVNYGSHFHAALYLAMQPLILQKYAVENNYQWAMMLDVDSYFVGNFVAKLISEVKDICEFKHFFVVDQSHPEMACSDRVTGVPGAGFQMWQVSSPYVARYTLGFHTNHQTTFCSRMEDQHYLRYIRLIYPGYHFVYPFTVNANFSKQDALRHAPAYFHVGVGQGGPNVMWQLKKFDEWFNPEYTE